MSLHSASNGTSVGLANAGTDCGIHCLAGALSDGGELHALYNKYYKTSPAGPGLSVEGISTGARREFSGARRAEGQIARSQSNLEQPSIEVSRYIPLAPPSHSYLLPLAPIWGAVPTQFAPGRARGAGPACGKSSQ